MLVLLGLMACGKVEAPAAVPAAGKDTLVTGSTSRQSGTAVVNGTRGRVIGN